MRPSWSGTLTFGLVAIPITLQAAVRSKERVSFHLLHEKDLSQIRYDRVCEKEGKSVPWDEIVKGYEYQKGKFVVLTDDDFRAAALESTKTLEIVGFVNGDEIDPRFFETPYYVLPGKGAEKPYALLRAAINETARVGIGRITMRSNSFHLVSIRAVGDALVLEIMRFADELVDIDSMSFPKESGVRPQELQMAKQLIENLTETFDPSQYEDEYKANLMKIIRTKMKGETIELEEAPQPKGTPVLDLISRLQESIAQGKTSGRASAGGTRSKAKKGTRPAAGSTSHHRRKKSA